MACRYWVKHDKLVSEYNTQKNVSTIVRITTTIKEECKSPEL